MSASLRLLQFRELRVLALFSRLLFWGSYRFWCCLRQPLHLLGVIGPAVVYTPSPFGELSILVFFYVSSPFGELSVLALLMPLQLLESFRSWRCLRPFTFWRVIGPGVVCVPSLFVKNV